MLKKLLIAVVVMGAWYSTVAQNVEGVNARIDGMGGSGTIGDIGWSIDKPSALFGYLDKVQASVINKDIEGIGKAYGAIIAIKSIGENVALGVTWNDRRALSGTFYKIAQEFGGFNDNFGGMANARYFPKLPHVNLGFKVGEQTFGIGAYMEASKHDAAHNKEFRYSHTNGTNALLDYDSTTLSKYFGIGFSACARIWAGKTKFNPEFRMFMPKLERKLETDIVDKLNGTNHDLEGTGTYLQYSNNAVSTDFAKNLYMRMGLKVSSTIQESLWWIVGYWYKNEKFELEREIAVDTLVAVAGGPDTKPATTIDKQNSFAFNTTYHDLWIGLEPKFSDDLIMSLEYSGTLKKYAPTHELETEDTTKLVFRHILRFGTEAKLDGFWNFEEFLPRFGIKYTLFQEVWKFDNIQDDFDTTQVNEHITYPWSSDCEVGFNDAGKGTKIATGFGLKSRRGAFDISCDILTWVNGTITGPSAAMASWTLYFGRLD